MPQKSSRKALRVQLVPAHAGHLLAINPTRRARARLIRPSIAGTLIAALPLSIAEAALDADDLSTVLAVILALRTQHGDEVSLVLGEPALQHHRKMLELGREWLRVYCIMHKPRRLFANVDADYSAGRRYARALGFAEEATLKNAGTNGDIVVCSYKGVDEWAT